MGGIMALNKCPKSLDGKHILVGGEIYKETYPFFGLTLLARRKLARIVIRCHACGLTIDATEENIRMIKKQNERK